MVIGAIMAKVSNQLGGAFEYVLITLTEAGRPILWGQSGIPWLESWTVWRAGTEQQ